MYLSLELYIAVYNWNLFYHWLCIFKKGTIQNIHFSAEKAVSHTSLRHNILERCISKRAQPQKTALSFLDFFFFVFQYCASCPERGVCTLNLISSLRKPSVAPRLDICHVYFRTHSRSYKVHDSWISFLKTDAPLCHVWYCIRCLSFFWCVSGLKIAAQTRGMKPKPNFSTQKAVWHSLEQVH